MMKLLDRIDAIGRVIWSKNFILIYDIKQRVEGSKLKMKSKIQRHTSGTVYEDIETLENATHKVVNKIKHE